MTMQIANTISGHLFCVFESSDREPESLPTNRVLLTSSAEARWLTQALSPLYGTAGISISSSDDEVVEGKNLQLLRTALEEAVRDVSGKPAKWSVFLGHKGNKHGPAIHQEAKRENLISFLRDVLKLVEVATNRGTYIYWAGGE